MENPSFVNISDVNKKIVEIQRMSDNGSTPADIHGSGIVLLQNYSKGTTGSGKPKYAGTIVNLEEVKFNTWNNSRAFLFFEKLTPTTLPHAAWIDYSVSKYGLVINSIHLEDGYDPDMFITHKYSTTDVIRDFFSTLSASGISDNGMAVINTVLHYGTNDFIDQRLIREFAAYSHHDNCATGLLAHMTKCIKIYNGIKDNYSFLKDPRTNDLMVISLALHDIGKVYEMHDGVYQGFSFITHRGLGFEHLIYHKSMIVERYGADFFYMLASVLLQHHGEYGENPRTVYAMLVHLIDDMEAQFTSIDDLLHDDVTTTDASGTKIKFNGSYLNVLKSLDFDQVLEQEFDIL